MKKVDKWYLGIFLVLVFAACKNPIIEDWYRGNSQNQSSAAQSQTEPSAPQTVNDLALTYNMPAPYGGKTPVRSFAGPQYEGRVDWSTDGGPHNGTFITGTVYRAVATLEAAAGCTFTGVGERRLYPRF